MPTQLENRILHNEKLLLLVIKYEDGFGTHIEMECEVHFKMQLYFQLFVVGCVNVSCSFSSFKPNMRFILSIYSFS